MIRNIEMKKKISVLLGGLLIGSLVWCGSASAQDTSDNPATETAAVSLATGNPLTDSALSSDWSFGLQAAPLTFGISVRHNFNNQWMVQGVLSPNDGEPAVALRALRISTQKRFWQSYLFAGVATAKNETYYFDDVSFNGADEAYREMALTTGLGVEWAWTAKNPSLPPLSWSLELGLNYNNRVFDNDSISSDGELRLAVGAAIHYQFE